MREDHPLLLGMTGFWGTPVANEKCRTADVILAAPDWRLEQAASEMVRGGFRHIIVVDGADVVGILSMRDIVRCWTAEGATSELASGAALG